MMARSSRRLRTFLLCALASVGMVVVGCFIINSLIDPLWYLRGNVIGEINYAFNERLAKANRFLPRMQDYDCVIFGTSRATMLPTRDIQGHRCFNLAFSDGQVSEYLPYARYLRQRGFTPSLLIVEIRRSDLIGPELPAVIPEFIRLGEAPPSILASYLTLDALHFSIRTLRGDSPHHRFYDKDFEAHLAVRSKRRWYNPAATIKPAPPHDVHVERAGLYRQLRQEFPMAHAIGYIAPESAWRVAALSLTSGFDKYLAVIGEISTGFDQFLDFSVPSPLTTSKLPADTYDGVHYSRAINQRVWADLLANRSDAALDWRREEPAVTAALLRRRIAEFIATTAGIEVAPKETSKRQPRSDEGD